MDLYELMGFIAGDGYIFYNTRLRKYRIEFVGNVQEDYDYFEKIVSFLITVSNNNPKLFVRHEKKGKSLRLMIYDKMLIDKIIALGIPAGKKTFTVSFPPGLSLAQTISFVRGLFEADGCLFFSKSKKMDYPSYPRLEIKTSSKTLLDQLSIFFRENNFNFYIRNPSGDRTFAIGVSGVKILIYG